MEGYRGMGWTSEKLCDFLNYIKVNDGSRGKERESEDEDNRTLGGALEKEGEKERAGLEQKDQMQVVASNLCFLCLTASFIL